MRYYIRVSAGDVFKRKIHPEGVDLQKAQKVLANERRFSLMSSDIVRGSPEEGWLEMQTDPSVTEGVSEAGPPLRFDIVSLGE